AAWQGRLKQPAAVLLMDVLWIDPHAVAYPDFVRVARLDVWLLLQEGYLGGNLAGQPQVVRVQKGHQCAARCRYTAVARRTDASASLSDIGQRRSERLHDLRSGVVRAIVHYDQLQVRVGLGQDGSNRLTYPGGAVKGGDDHADERLGYGRGHRHLNSPW